MKLHILFRFQDGPWGGGNQFLKGLREDWRRRGVYSEAPESADGILFNSHHELMHVARLRLLNPRKIFIHRLDGVFSTQRAHGVHLDRAIYRASAMLADGMVFQSEWSRARSIEQGFMADKPFAVIPNVPLPEFFQERNAGVAAETDRKIKIILSSWSKNAKKGFSLYDFLDENVDFSRYEITFVGNSPQSFRNIRMLQPQDSQSLARTLKEHDIYLTASADDACSNSLLEALYSGITVLALDSGGHPELLSRGGGEIFQGEKDVLQKIDAIAGRIRAGSAPKARSLPSFGEIAERYRKFFQDCHHAKTAGECGDNFRWNVARFSFSWLQYQAGDFLRRFG